VSGPSPAYPEVALAASVWRHQVEIIKFAESAPLFLQGFLVVHRPKSDNTLTEIN
jgi:hypothetical protein